MATAGDIIKVSRNTKNAPTSSASTQTVAFSHYNNISAQLPVDPRTGEIVDGGIDEQTRRCCLNIRAIVESINHVMDDVLKVTIFLRDIADIEAVDAVYGSFFGRYLPSRTTVAVAALPLSGALVQIEAVVSNGEGTTPQDPCDLVKVAVNTVNAPTSPVATQAVAFSHYNNISAQLPVDPATGLVVAGGIEAQAQQCLKNLRAVLDSLGVPLDDVVKTNLFLTDLSDSDVVDGVYSQFFPHSAIARAAGYVPARTVVNASALPLGALIQVDAVVSHGDGTQPQLVEDRHGIVIRASNTESSPKNQRSTQTVAFSHYNHISGQLPVDASTGEVVAGGVVEQVTQCLHNIREIVESVDHGMDDIVKLSIQLRDVADAAAVDNACTAFFKGELPAKTTVGVSAIPLDGLVQVDAVVSNCEGTAPQE
jgi:reactive intermediate/imine deaminase